MPEIADLMDVNLEDLSPEQRQQLQDVVDQFQQKCLLSFKKNRSGVPYLKNEMPRVLLPGESDTTCNILEFSPGMLAMRKCGFQNFDLKLSA
jgi:hypothetical protein